MTGRSRSDPARVLATIRQRRPLIHCLTNDVTAGRVADALAALGALPVMAHAPEEAADMVEHAQALVLNLGTPAAARWRAAEDAAARARERQIPIVLDPVGCGATPWRTEQGRVLARLARPEVVRGNAPEVAALAGIAPSNATLRGVTAEPGDENARDTGAVEAERFAREAAGALDGVIVVTGAVDVLTDGQQVLHHRSRAPLLARVVGAGDVLSALIGACRAVEPDSLAAAWAGLALFAAAARSAEAASAGPGTFWLALFDRLSDPTLGAETERDARLLETV